MRIFSSIEYTATNEKPRAWVIFQIKFFELRLSVRQPIIYCTLTCILRERNITVGVSFVPYSLGQWWRKREKYWVNEDDDGTGDRELLAHTNLVRSTYLSSLLRLPLIISLSLSPPFFLSFLYPFPWRINEKFTGYPVTPSILSQYIYYSILDDNPQSRATL